MVKLGDDHCESWDSPSDSWDSPSDSESGTQKLYVSLGLKNVF